MMNGGLCNRYRCPEWWSLSKSLCPLQYRYPQLLKVSFTPLRFMLLRFMPLRFTLLCYHDRPMLAPVFAKQEKAKEDFHFCDKRRKAKIVFSICFAAALIEAAAPQAVRVAPPTSFPENYTQCLSTKLPWLGTLSICVLSLFILCIC